MCFQEIRYIDNWMHLAEAIDLLYMVTNNDQDTKQYYKSLNEIQFFVNSMSIELEETKLQLQKYQMAFNKCLSDKQDATQHQNATQPTIKVK